MAISMLKIRRTLGRLIFNMGITISGKTVFLIEIAPRAAAGMVLTKFTWNTLLSTQEGLNKSLIGCKSTKIVK